jgi:hypothetical protein
MNWVPACLSARFRRGHSRRKLFATGGLLTGWEVRLAGPSSEERLEGDS